MLINFTLETIRACKSRYTMAFTTSVVPTIGSTICFPCDAPGGQRGYYFKVEDVIYYPLKRGSVGAITDGNMTVQVIFRSTYRDLKPLISTQNTMNPGVWEERPKEDSAAA